MRKSMLVAAAFLLSAQSPPPARPTPAGQFAVFDSALARSDFESAKVVIYDLIRSRVPNDGRPKPDSQINALIGRIDAAGRQWDEAVAYLNHAQSADLPAEMRAAARIAHAQALEHIGDRSAALAQFREAASFAQTPEDRERSALGVARQLVIEDPLAAQRTLNAIAAPSESDRWEVALLLAEASSLLNDDQGAQRLSALAWSQSLSARAEALAPLRAGAFRAGLAARHGERDTEKAMLNAISGSTATVNSSLLSQLPVCGDDGLIPTDFVIVGITSGLSHQDLVPVSQSRPGVMAAFFDQLSGRKLIGFPDSAHVGGTVAKLSCRTTVSDAFQQGHEPSSPISSWFAERGLYPAPVAEKDKANGLASWIDGVVARSGTDSPLLISPRIELADSLFAAAAEGEAVDSNQLLQIGDAVVRGLKSANAPADVISEFSAGVERYKSAKASGQQSASFAQASRSFRESVEAVPFRTARILIGQMKAESDEQRALIAQVVLDLNASAPNFQSARERQSWSLQVADAERTVGKDAQAIKLISSAMSPDICAAMDTPPAMLKHEFSYEDYPADLSVGEQLGYTYMNFDLDREGLPTRIRQIVSLPSGLFDQASAKGIQTVRYAPPLKGGRPSPCRSIYQPIVWKLQSEPEQNEPGSTRPPVGLPDAI